MRESVTKSAARASGTTAALSATAEAIQRHPSKRITTSNDGRSAIKPGRRRSPAAKTFTPARSTGELHDQVGKIIEAFREREDRDPGVDDKEFWVAYAKLVGRFADAHPAPPEEVRKPLRGPDEEDG